MYATSGRAHLRRAQECLSAGTQEALFYAALELRTGIESRMHEYLEARADISRRKKHGYQIAKLARGLESVFSSGEKVVEIKGVGEDNTTLWVLHFTPVRAVLHKHAAKLGDVL